MSFSLSGQSVLCHSALRDHHLLMDEVMVRDPKVIYQIWDPSLTSNSYLTKDDRVLEREKKMLFSSLKSQSSSNNMKKVFFFF